MFWGFGLLQIQIDLLRNLGSKVAHGKLGDFFRLCGFPEHKNAGKYEFLGCTCVEPFVLFVFFGFLVFFTFPLKRSVLEECRKGHDGGRKGQTVSLCRAHTMPTKQGKSNMTTIGLITGIGLKTTSKQGKNAKRTNGSILTQLHVHELPKERRSWKCEVAAAHKCWPFDIFEVHEARNAGFLGRGRFSKHNNAGNSEELYP